MSRLLRYREVAPAVAGRALFAVIEWPRTLGLRMLAALRSVLRRSPSTLARSAASFRIRLLGTPSALAVASREGYGVSILAFFTAPRYAAPKGLVNSPRPRRHLSRIHPVQELRRAVARPRPGVLPQFALVDVGPPARRVAEPDVAIADRRLLGDEGALPGHVVDVDLHDAHVRQHGAEMQRMQVGQVAVIVVRGDVDLARLGQPPDLHGLRETVPRHVDDGHVHRVLLQKRPVLAQAHQALARGQSRRGRLLDL